MFVKQMFVSPNYLIVLILFCFFVKPIEDDSCMV